LYWIQATICLATKLLRTVAYTGTDWWCCCHWRTIGG